jgi:hypothetical protein
MSVQSLRLPYEFYSCRVYYMFPWRCLQMLFCEIVGSVSLTKVEIIIFWHVTTEITDSHSTLHAV